MTVGIVANFEKREVSRIVPEFLDWLRKRGVGFFVDARLAARLKLGADNGQALDPDELCQHCDMLVAFGGDGTILSTARIVGRSGIPILGVKIGGMGFLAEVTPEELYSSFEEVLDGSYEVVERMVLECRLRSDGEDEPLFALNDFVLDKGAVSRVIRIKTFIDEDYLNTYIADGLIISTPTGSTAYSLAAGGPILLPSMDAIIINPISPHTLSARPVVIPGSKSVAVEIVSAPQEVMLSADGQVSVALSPGQKMRIHKADYRIKLMTYPGRSFYDVLHTKLNWGEDIRENS